MEWSSFSSRFRFSRAMALLQIVLGAFVILVSLASLHKFYSLGFFLHDDTDLCRSLHAAAGNSGIDHVAGAYVNFDLRALSDRVEDVLEKLSALQEKLESTVQNIDKNKQLRAQNMSRSEFRRFLDEDVIQPLYGTHVGLCLIRLPRLAEEAEEEHQEGNKKEKKKTKKKFPEEFSTPVPHPVPSRS